MSSEREKFTSWYGPTRCDGGSQHMTAWDAWQARAALAHEAPADEVESVADWLSQVTCGDPLSRYPSDNVWPDRWRSAARHVIARIESEKRKAAEVAANFAWEMGNNTGLIHPQGEENPAVREYDIDEAVSAALGTGE